MAYRFKKDELLPHAVRRIVAEEISWAVGQLRYSKKRVEAVHEARKSTKKLRALLTLLHDKSQDRRFRDAARLLSQFRDTDVMLEVFDQLTRKHPDFDPAVISKIRQTLGHSEAHAHAAKDAIARVIELFEQTPPLQVPELEKKDLLPAVVACYKKGRKALARAHKNESAENLHGLRKKVKEHWYHLRLFEREGNENDAKRLSDLHAMETALGDDHNLFILAERLKAEAETSQDRHQLRAIIAWIEEESKHLQSHAIHAGVILYAEKPGVFSKLMFDSLETARKRPQSATPELRVKSAVA